MKYSKQNRCKDAKMHRGIENFVLQNLKSSLFTLHPSPLKAFSLAEVLIVLAILVIIAAAATPLLTKKHKRPTSTPPHGQYECYVRSGNVYEKLSSESAEGTETYVGPLGSNCTFTQPTKKAAYFMVASVGGGAGGSATSGGKAGDLVTTFFSSFNEAVTMTPGVGGTAGNNGTGGTTYFGGTSISAPGGVGIMESESESEEEADPNVATSAMTCNGTVVYLQTGRICVAPSDASGAPGTWSAMNQSCTNAGMRLPTKEELTEIYNNRSRIGGLYPSAGASHNDYWSNSVYGGSHCISNFASAGAILCGWSITDDDSFGARCVKDYFPGPQMGITVPGGMTCGILSSHKYPNPACYVNNVQSSYVLLSSDGYSEELGIETVSGDDDNDPSGNFIFNSASACEYYNDYSKDCSDGSCSDYCHWDTSINISFASADRLLTSTSSCSGSVIGNLCLTQLPPVYTLDASLIPLYWMKYNKIINDYFNLRISQSNNSWERAAYYCYSNGKRLPTLNELALIYNNYTSGGNTAGLSAQSYVSSETLQHAYVSVKNFSTGENNTTFSRNSVTNSNTFCVNDYIPSNTSSPTYITTGEDSGYKAYCDAGNYNCAAPLSGNGGSAGIAGYPGAILIVW